MRHRNRGRVLGRKAPHRRAMFSNMASSLLRSLRFDDDDPKRPKVPGRIVTTVPKAKEFRPIIEKLVTMAVKGLKVSDAAEKHGTTAARNTEEWKRWRTGSGWTEWNQAIAPAVALRRRAFAFLRDNEAVDILFTEVAQRFEKRPGGYVRIVRLAKPRLGDAGARAIVEFVGERDRKRQPRKAPAVAPSVAPAAAPSPAPAPAEGSPEPTAT